MIVLIINTIVIHNSAKFILIKPATAAALSAKISITYLSHNFSTNCLAFMGKT